MTLSILAVILIAYSNVKLVRSDCKLTIRDDFTDSSPLFLNIHHAFYYPGTDEPDTWNLDWFQDFLVYCPNGVAKLGNDELRSRPAQPYHLPPVVRCIKDDIFELEAGNQPHFQLKKLQCSENPSPIAWTNGQMCGRAKIFHLGYKLDTVEKEIISVCYDDIEGTTYWAASFIPECIAKKQIVKRPDFKKHSFYENINIGRFYQGCEQIDTFARIFRYQGKAAYGSDSDSDDSMDDSDSKPGDGKIDAYTRDYIQKYIRVKTTDATNPLTKKNFFVKGHLIAQADMFYAAEQFATYVYANAVPMWDSINNGNWKTMEGEVRTLAKNYGGVDVIAGGIGVLQLEGQDIYLGRRKHQKNLVMPVPQVLFKAVYSRSTNKGIVYLAINNPYVTDAEFKDYEVCKEYLKCRNPTYDNRYKGFVWCCLIWDFLEAPKVKDINLHVDVPKNVEPIL